MLHVKVNRRRWLRGQDAADNGSFLRRETDGKQCCLGFAARAAGLTRKQITGKATPSDLLDSGVVKRLPKALQGLIKRGINGRTCERLMTTNDKEMEYNGKLYETFSESTRERRVRAFGKRVGIRFTFHGR